MSKIALHFTYSLDGRPEFTETRSVEISAVPPDAYVKAERARDLYRTAIAGVEALDRELEATKGKKGFMLAAGSLDEELDTLDESIRALATKRERTAGRLQGLLADVHAAIAETRVVERETASKNLAAWAEVNRSAEAIVTVAKGAEKKAREQRDSNVDGRLEREWALPTPQELESKLSLPAPKPAAKSEPDTFVGIPRSMSSEPLAARAPHTPTVAFANPLAKSVIPGV
jgi:hypothetical protein